MADSVDSIKWIVLFIKKRLMHKQLSRKSHRPFQQSIDDFMKNIRRYNLKSQRYLSPKPLLNPAINTIERETRSKSKTLSNRQHSHHSKKTSQVVREKVSKMLSITKEKHRKSQSSISLSKSHRKNLSRFSGSGSSVLVQDFSALESKKKKKRKSKGKGKSSLNKHKPKEGRNQILVLEKEQAEQIENPADLIEKYSHKVQQVEKYLESKSKMGQLMCQKFQQMLNHIIESFVVNLKSSLDSLEVSVEKRLAESFQIEFKKSTKESNNKITKLEKHCKKLEKKCLSLLEKQNYSNTLVYNLRLRGIDIDRQFGRAIYNSDNFGGSGYEAHKKQSQNPSNFSHSNDFDIQMFAGSVRAGGGGLGQGVVHTEKNSEFQFQKHPNKVKRQQQQLKRNGNQFEKPLEKLQNFQQRMMGTYTEERDKRLKEYQQLLRQNEMFEKIRNPNDQISGESQDQEDFFEHRNSI